MSRKDPSHVDLPSADADADTTLSRRGIIARAAAASLASLAAMLVVERRALASPPSTDAQPNIPTAADKVLLEQVIGWELAASELFTAALEVVPEELSTVVSVMANNHLAYAQQAAGSAGLSADTVDQQMVDDNIDAFTGSTDEFLSAAHTLEQTAVATCTEAVGQYESEDAIALTAAIAVVEARQATVLALLADNDDFDVLFGNDADPLEFSGADA